LLQEMTQNQIHSKLLASNMKEETTKRNNSL